MGAESRRRLASAVAFGLLLTLSFPFRAGEFRFDVGMAAGWVVLVPFVWMLSGLRAWAAFRWATASATLGYAGVLFWVYVAARVYGHAPAVVAVASVLLLGGYIGLHVGLAATLYVTLRPWAGPLAPLVLPAAWVATEHLRSFDLFGGFPWAYLGYALHEDGPMLELAALGGVWGLGLLLALVAVLVGERRFVTAMALLAAAHALGFGLRLTARPSTDEPLVALVQASIAQGEKWDPQRVREGFDLHLKLSRLAAAAGEVDLIVWPEAAIPLLLELEPDYQRDVAALARETVIGLVRGRRGRSRCGTGGVCRLDPRRRWLRLQLGGTVIRSKQPAADLWHRACEKRLQEDRNNCDEPHLVT